MVILCDLYRKVPDIFFIIYFNLIRHRFASKNMERMVYNDLGPFINAFGGNRFFISVFAQDLSASEPIDLAIRTFINWMRLKKSL